MIDPGKYNYTEGFTPEKFGRVDVLIVTHKHADHHDVEAEKLIYDLWKPKIYSSVDIADNEDNLLPYNGVQPGDSAIIEGVRLNFINTDHFAKGEHVEAVGVLITDGNKRIYHTSDTRFMESEMFDLDAVKGVDVLFVPISNRGLVMGIDDAITFTALIQPEIVVLMHYDSPKDRVRVKPEDFVERFNMLKERLSELKDTVPKVLNFAEGMDI